MKPWTKQRRAEHSRRMKKVWARKTAKEKLVFDTTKKDIWATWQRNDNRKTQTLDQFFDMALRFVGPEIMLNMLRKMVHEFIDGKDFTV